MLGLFKRQPPPRPAALALDIGTEFVKALVFEVQDGQAFVTGSARERQKLSSMQGGTVTDIAGVIASASRALDVAFAQAGREATQVVIGIAGELVKGTTSTSTISRTKRDVAISEAELREIIQSAQKDTLKRSRRELAWETGYSEVDVELVSSAVVSVKVDGYSVTNPIGFKGHEVEIGTYTSYAPAVHHSALQTVASELGLDLLAITTEPYAVARCFGAQESGDVSSVFIDVGGGTTDIAVVRAGGLEGTKMFAMGGRVFTRRIASSLKVPFEEAETIKLAYSDSRLDPADISRIREFMADDLEVWLAGVELALEEFTQSERFADNRMLPSRFYLCGGGSLLPDLQAKLVQHAWTKRLPFAKQPDVQYIKPGSVANVVDTTETLRSTQDVTPMALANIALDLVGNDSVVASTVNQVLRGLRS